MQIARGRAAPAPFGACGPTGRSRRRAWFADGRDTGSFELIVNPTFNYMEDPDLFLERYTTGDSNNWGRFSDPRIDDLFARQARALDPHERKKLINEIEKIVLENAYYIPGPLVGAERGALGEGEELRGATQSLLQPEAPGRLAGRRLSG